MKAEIIGIMMFISTLFLSRKTEIITTFAKIGSNELFLVFSLVFTFSVGMEVIK